ncbi:MAG: LysR family transcriptional regulator [Sphingobium sp.]|nr:LysR family transcriptional regulator [Sphingobium sp.]
MELRHIRYFLAVAEEGNFTRAAIRLGIGQPPLSLQIKDLEREIGAQLFHRVPHGAELTEAGTAFLENVRDMPEQASNAMRAAQRASRGETGKLRLGFTGTAALNPVMPEAIRAFRRDYPDAELILEEANSVALATKLIAGHLDAAILRPSESDPVEIRKYVLMQEPLVVVLPASHPAARDGAPIDLASLATTPLILTPRMIGIGLHDAAISACRASGFEPIMGQSAPQIASILSLVSAELGFSLVPTSMVQLNLGGICFRRLPGDQANIDLAIAHLRTRPPQPALNFTQIARAVATQAQPPM